jgi:hypothetical protein
MPYSPTATAEFVKAVRAFSLRTPGWAEALRYYTKPDERTDITLIAERVYGSRSEYMAIFAAAGLDTLEQVIPEQQLVLPTSGQLMLIKRQTGYLTDEERRAFEALN